MTTNTRDYSAEYRRRNRDKMRETHLRWRLAHPERVREMNRKRRAKVAADPIKAARVKALRRLRYERDKAKVFAARPAVTLTSRGAIVDFSQI